VKTDAQRRRQLAAIRRAHAILKRPRRPGEKSFVEEWADHKREELALEEPK
jgi:hypothetical protein